MPAFALADLFYQSAISLGRSRCRIRLEIVGEKRSAVLIQHLEKEPIGKLNRGQAPANPFHQDGDSNVAQDGPVWRAHCADDIGDRSVVR